MAAPGPQTRTEIIPYIFYRDVAAALDWLALAFGFTETMREATPSGGVHGEMTLHGQRIMMGQGGRDRRMLSASETQAVTQGVFVYLDEVDAHFARAQAARAAIDKPPEDLPYGRGYAARDLEGHPWFFTTPPAAI
jgi:PhnB protein